MKKNTNRDNIVGIHAVRILLKIRPYDVYEIYMSDKSALQFNEIALEARNNNITIQNISNDKIYDLTNVKSHQGVLAIAKKK